MAFNFVQLQDLYLAGGGITSTDTSISVTSLAYPDGTLVTMADFGTTGYGTLEPDTSSEENFSFTGITQNADGSATFTGVTRGLMFKTPYTQDLALRVAHGGATLLRITNSAPFYDQMVNNDNDETITGKYTFPSTEAARPRANADTDTAIDEAYITRGQLARTALASAIPATQAASGYVELPTIAEVRARTATGGTGSGLAVTPDVLPAVLYSDYAVDSVGTDAYAIAPTPAITAYTAGQVFVFKAGTANTGACSLNVSGLGAKTIKKDVSTDLETGDIVANQDVMVVYDGTNMQLVSRTSNLAQKIQDSTYIYAADAVGTDSYAITLSPAPAAYATGQKFVFKAGTANTGAATLNVNSLGAKSIVKSYNVALETGDIKANQDVCVVYDGTNFQMVSPSAALDQGISTPLTTNHAHRSTTFVATYDVSTASGSVNYAHGLGVAPNWVRITAMVANGTGVAKSFGFYDKAGSLNRCVYTNDPGATPTVGNSTTNTVTLSVSAGSATGVVTTDATNVVIAWTKAASPTGTANLLFECGV